MSINFFYGAEDFNIDLEIEKMRSQLNPDFIAMSFQTYDNPEYQDLINVLRTPPMMFGNSLIIINSEKYFLTQKNFFEDKELEDIQDALKNNPDSLNIVFVVKIPREDKKKIDSRRKLFKILSKYNAKEFQPYSTFKVKDLENWINNRAKIKNIKINNDATELLIEYIGNNLRHFDIELEKLKLIAYPDTTITKKMVEEIAISNEDLFNITELIMKQQKDKALLEFRKLSDKKHPLEILAAIQTILKQWIIIKSKSGTTSAYELSKIIGLQEFIINKNITKLKNTKLSDIVQLKQNLYEAECKIKKGEALDINMEVEIALIK